ncbi:hypothetical protein DFH09DRAFT_355620 [Mycena vulgaris]|nr:hypothetical protein DFH09DRAFT_355620 [Mycena vulgaris]
MLVPHRTIRPLSSRKFESPRTLDGLPGTPKIAQAGGPWLSSLYSVPGYGGACVLRPVSSSLSTPACCARMSAPGGCASSSPVLGFGLASLCESYNRDHSWPGNFVTGGSLLGLVYCIWVVGRHGKYGLTTPVVWPVGIGLKCSIAVLVPLVTLSCQYPWLGAEGCGGTSPVWVVSLTVFVWSVDSTILMSMRGVAYEEKKRCGGRRARPFI